MNEIKPKVMKLIKQLRGYFPVELPVGMTALDNFMTEIFETYDLPDMPSYRHAVASMIMHLGPQTHTCAPMHFVKTIKKAMANQVAYEKIQAIKEEEKKAKELETAQVVS